MIKQKSTSTYKKYIYICFYFIKQFKKLNTSSTECSKSSKINQLNNTLK